MLCHANRDRRGALSRRDVKATLAFAHPFIQKLAAIGGAWSLLLLLLLLALSLTRCHRAPAAVDLPAVDRAHHFSLTCEQKERQVTREKAALGGSREHF